MKEKTENSGRQSVLVTAFCTLLMISLGASDALRGVFAPAFANTFAISEAKIGLLLTISYLGNLFFLFFGGKFLDKYPKKHVLYVAILIWLAALTFYLCTRRYCFLLFGMFFSMGASTLLSTTVNVITPILFASSGFFINIFNFSQGVGITAAQNLAGRGAESFAAWKCANAALLAAGIVSLLLLSQIHFPAPKREKATNISHRTVFRHPAFLWLTLLCSFYCIAEHGLLNWLVTYGHTYLGLRAATASFYLSLFFGGITIGRLLFAPLVQKIGIRRSMGWFTGAAGILYIAGILLGKPGLPLLCTAGLAFSIIWPTMILMIQRYYPPQCAGMAVGLIVSLAALADILFNATFGGLTAQIGFGKSILILPVAMALFCFSFFMLQHRAPLQETDMR